MNLYNNSGIYSSLFNNTILPPNSQKNFLNTRGTNTEDMFLVLLDSKTVSGSSAENFVYNNVKFKLAKPIIIDTQCEVYIEFIHLQNLDVSDTSGSEIQAHLESTSQFYLKIDELTCQNTTNNSFMDTHFFIGNDVYGKSDIFANDNDQRVQTKYNRNKTNFLCILEPTTIREFTLTLRADKYGSGYSAGPPETEEYYYLANKGKVDGSYNTYGYVKLALLFKKIKKK